MFCGSVQSTGCPPGVFCENPASDPKTRKTITDVRITKLIDKRDFRGFGLLSASQFRLQQNGPGTRNSTREAPYVCSTHRIPVQGAIPARSNVKIDYLIRANAAHHRRHSKKKYSQVGAETPGLNIDFIQLRALQIPYSASSRDLPKTG